ncbi:SDR family oxidoreductase [Demequina sp. NBRC 110056]|uniref:SDR family oxidoreductase n=1 Tax=Demequina sp. NBRC 110056 TaxID=1570345 RepID=UPI0026F469CB|nr:SDR family oxidoreductase [Demequina sp. NBRC 110056]
MITAEVRELFSLEGRTALITGAGRGIGKAIACGLAGAGADVVLAGRNGSVERTAELLTEQGYAASTVAWDLEHTDTLQQEARELAQERSIDILVNNAGIIERTPSVEVSQAQWRRVLSVNLDAAFVLSQAFGAAMIERGHGKVINVASLLAFQGGLRVASYSASKHGIMAVTQALSNEWAQHGVQVNAIAPGYIATANTEELREDSARSAEILARIPSARWGEPTDISGAAVFLASRASDYVTGHTLVVDGGWMAR